MKAYVYFTIMILILIVSGCTSNTEVTQLKETKLIDEPQESEDPGIKTYTNKIMNVKFNHPSNWHVVFEEDHVVELFNSNRSDLDYKGYPLNPDGFEVFTAPVRVNLEGYTKFMIDSFDDYIFNFKEHESGEVMINGKKFYRIVYSGKERGTDIKKLEYWTVHGKKVYSLVYKSSGGQYDKDISDAEVMINSFEII